MKDPWVPCPADDLSDPMVVATTASQGLRHGSVSGTLGFPLRARAAGKGDFPFDYRRVAVANMSLVNVCGRCSGNLTRQEKSALGSHRVYWVWFDEPQLDAEGEGPYSGGQIWESALTLLSR